MSQFFSNIWSGWKTKQMRKKYCRHSWVIIKDFAMIPQYFALTALLCGMRLFGAPPSPGQSLVQWDVWCWQVEPGCRLYRPYVTMCWPHSHSKRNEKTPSISVLKKTTGSLCSHVCVLYSANGSKTTEAQWHMASITFHSRALVNTEWRITSVLLKPHLQQISDVHHQRYR